MRQRSSRAPFARGMWILASAVLAATSAVFGAQAGPGANTPGTRPATPTQQRPATPTTQTPPPAPAPAPAPVRRPAAPAPVGRGGLAIVVTDMAGAGLGGVRVQAIGPTERGGTSDASGRLIITGMQAGTYRLRFSGDAVTDFEREVVVRGGANTEVDVTLRPAPPPVVITQPAPAAPPPPPAAAPVGPIGAVQATTIVNFLDRELIKGEPRKETVLSCSANTRTTLVQMNQDQAVRLYDNADVTYYVVAGEGTMKVDSRDVALEATSYVSVPRGTRFSVARRGRRPLILVMQLSGEPCEEPK